MVLALVCSGVIAVTPGAAAAPAAGTEGPLVPWFVPRSASLGVFINPPLATPHFRIAWEGAIVSQPRNDLIWLLTLGSGVGVGVPSPMTTHAQHTVMAGVGYRSDHEVVTWGFHVVSGVVWYQANYLPGSFYQAESRVLGYIEGRVQLGVRLSPHFRLIPYFGYASPFSFNFLRFPGNSYVGGFDVGLVVDWR